MIPRLLGNATAGRYQIVELRHLYTDGNTSPVQVESNLYIQYVAVSGTGTGTII